jgi:hypothetical protein
MGCDIHSYAEIKKDNKWEKLGNVFPNEYYRKEEEGDGNEWNVPFVDHPYNSRCYNLFAILADVRNGRGFAGIPTGDGFTPISEPKGLPDDVTPEVREESDEWDSDGHSHSWFTLKELQDYNWMQTTKSYGVVDVVTYKKWKETGEPPNNYCGDISGSNVVTVSNEELDMRIKSKLLNNGVDYYTRIEWGTTYKDAVDPYFFDTTMKVLAELSPNPEDIRIVFWFDN